MGTKIFSNPQALSSTLAALGMLQPRAIWVTKSLSSLGLGVYYIVTLIHNKLMVISIEFNTFRNWEIGSLILSNTAVSELFAIYINY